MYEDHTIEEKYLHNFSPKEKRIFYRQQQKRAKEMAKYQGKLSELVFFESPAIFANYEPEPNTLLEIKYILNRIAANDPRDTALELGSMDSVPNADRLALDIAKALRHNTICKTVILNNIGLTDNGLFPILRALHHKELSLLDIAGNKLTDKSLKVVQTFLADPETKWSEIRLGRVALTSEQKESLPQYPNLSFEVAAPLIRRFTRKIVHFFSQSREA